MTNHTAFTQHPNDVEICKRKPYELRLIDGFNGSIFQRLFPLSDDKRSYLAKWIAKMKAAGLIERMAHSRWNNSIFVVPKSKPGELRLLSDMRGINNVIEPNYIHCKTLHQIFEDIRGAKPKWFSTVDVKAAYFCIPYTPSSKSSNTFYADCGRFLNDKVESDTERYVYNQLIMGA